LTLGREGVVTIHSENLQKNGIRDSKTEVLPWTILKWEGRKLKKEEETKEGWIVPR